MWPEQRVWARVPGAGLTDLSEDVVLSSECSGSCWEVLSREVM